MKKTSILIAFVISFFSFESISAQETKENESKVIVLESKAIQQQKIAAIKEQIELNKNNPDYDLKAKEEELKMYENAIIKEEEK